MNQVSKTALIWIGAFAGILCLTVSGVSFADVGNSSSWNSNPNWADPENSDNGNSAPPTTGRSSRRHKNKEKDSLPFAPGTQNLAIEVGQAFLMGNLGDHYDDALSYQAHYTYGVSDIFGFDSTLGYSNHSNTVSASSGGLSMTSFTAGIRVNLAWFDRIIPYLSGGLGFYRPSETLPNGDSASAMLFGIHMGPGVSLALTNNLFFGSSITFHDVFGTTQQTSAGNVDLGGTYTTFMLHAGISF